MKILEGIRSPADLKALDRNDLPQLCREIRDYLLQVIPAVGGHFASSLGVVELTVALHYAFDAPDDRIIWDVGHQAYVHKILTGRCEALKKIRQYKGISGFLKRSESIYDVFGGGHASTSISAALGICTARDLKGEDFHVITVIGDGSLTGGMAYEGLNNAGQAGRNMLVILNDNNMSISPNVGAIAYYLNEIITNPLYHKIKNEVWDLTGKIPPITEKIRSLARRTQSGIKALILPGMFFEVLGFRYFGPVNGHDLNELIPFLQRIKNLPGPMLLHVLTKKGKGYADAEKNPEKYHGIKPLAPQPDNSPQEPAVLSYTEVFGKTMVRLARQEKKLCAITAAMCDGTGLNEFRDEFPDRFFDVGIAEEHAVTFAAGMAAAGYRPVVTIYSTFLQRAYDQIIHDVALQKLPVIFALDRGGLVGEDGPTHHGSFDLSYLNIVPNLVVAAPRNGSELKNMLYSALLQDRLPFAIRYPRAVTPDILDDNEPFEEILPGSWTILEQGENAAVLVTGSLNEECLKALPILHKQGIYPTIVNCRFVKPMDETLLKKVIEDHTILFTLEENSTEGGFGSKIARFLQEHEAIQKPQLHMRGIPDRFIEHGKRDILLENMELSFDKIAEWIHKIMQVYLTAEQRESGIDWKKL